MSSNDIIAELDKIFAEERTTQLTANEVDVLIRDEMTSITFYYIHEGLVKKAIPHDIYLKLLINKIINDKSKCFRTDLRYEMALFGLAFRDINRANPNAYFILPGVGVIHIIGYIFTLYNNADCFRSPDKYMMMLIILMYLGANLNLPIFSDNGAMYNDRENLFDVNKSKTVRAYLIERAQSKLVRSIEDIRQDMDKYLYARRSDTKVTHSNPLLTNQVITEIGIYLDLPNLIVSEVREIELAKYQDINIVSKSIDISESDMSKLLRYSILFNSPDMFQVLYLRLGVISYVNVNLLLLETSRVNRYTYLQGKWKLNIKTIVQDGAQFDVYQIEMMRKIGDEFLTEMVALYNQPRWKKECGVDGEPTRALRLLAYELNIDPFNSKSFICTRIKEITDSDPQTLVQAAIKMQKDKISSRYSNISDYIQGEPKYVCNNPDVELGNYVDLDLATYMDNNGMLWCFTKESFDNLIDKKINPFTTQVLPDEFIDSLREQRKLLQRLGVYQSNSKTVVEGINSLTSPDQIVSKEEDQKIVDRFEKILETEKIWPKNVRSLSIDQMNRISNELGEDVNYGLFDTSPGQRYVTFAISMMSMFRNDPNRIMKFVEVYTRVTK